MRRRQTTECAFEITVAKRQPPSLATPGFFELEAKHASRIGSSAFKDAKVLLHFDHHRCVLHVASGIGLRNFECAADEQSR